MGKILCVFILALTFPTIAFARPFDQQHEEMYMAALKYWGVTSTPSCNKTEKNLFSSSMERGLEGVAIVGEHGECLIEINEDHEPCIEITIIVHEEGHLLGYSHSEDKASFMNPNVPNIVCLGLAYRNTLLQYKRRKKIGHEGLMVRKFVRHEWLKLEQRVKELVYEID